MSGPPFDTILAVRQLTLAVGLSVAGVDYITPDISRSPSEVGGGFTEINSTPGMRLFLTAGLTKEEIGGKVLGDKLDRIPVTLVLAAEDRLAETCKWVKEKAAHQSGHAVASIDWGEPAGTAIDSRGLNSFDIAVAMLRYATVNQLTLIWTPEELYRLGSPVDRAETTLIVGTGINEEWLALLHRISNEVLIAEDTSHAMERLNEE